MRMTARADRIKIGLITCPTWNPCGPALGLGLLNGYLKQQGYDSFVRDLANEWRAVAGGEFRKAMQDVDSRLLESRDFVARLFSEHERFVQEKVDQLLASEAGVFGFSLYYTTRESSLELARRIKRRDPSRLIVCGGPECIRSQEMLLRIGAEEGIIDAIVPGVGETTLVSLLDGCRDGRFAVCPGAQVRTGTRFVDGGAAEPLGGLDGIPFPDFGDIDMALYRDPVLLPTYFGRGCFRQCAFCETHAYWGRWQNRSGARVVQEIAALCLGYPGIKRFEFCDPILNADVRELESFCDRILEARRSGLPMIEWSGSAVIRSDMTPALFRKMKAAGCRELHVGVESGSQRVLDSMRKQQTIPSVERFLKDARAAELTVIVNLMVGFPTETEADFRQTLDFVVRNAEAIESIDPSPVLVRENTYLHRHAFDEYGIDAGSFHTEFWSSQDGQNTYSERMRRLLLLCESASQAGITVGGAWLDIVKARFGPQSADKILSRESWPAPDRGLAVEAVPDEGVSLHPGEVFFNQGRWAAAAAEFEKAVAMEPDNGWAHCQLGKIYRLQRRWPEAEAALDKALELAPGDGWARIELGALYLDQDRLPEAAAEYENAAAMDRSKYEAHCQLGRIYRRQGRLAEAEAALLRALELDPGNDCARIELGALYEGQDKFIQAETEFERAIAIGRNNGWAFCELGRTYRRQGRLSAAEAALKKALEHDLRDGSAHIELGVLYQGQDRLAEAVAEFARAIAMDPDDGRAYFHLGQIHRKQGRWSEAVAALNKALELAPQDGSARSELAALFNSP